MAQSTVNVSGIEVANDKPFVLFGGMNVLESPEMAMEVAEAYVEATRKLGIPYVFKASFDKAIVQAFCKSVEMKLYVADAEMYSFSFLELYMDSILT